MRTTPMLQLFQLSFYFSTVPQPCSQNFIFSAPTLPQPYPNYISVDDQVAKCHNEMMKHQNYSTTWAYEEVCGKQIPIMNNLKRDTDPDKVHVIINNQIVSYSKNSKPDYSGAEENLTFHTPSILLFCGIFKGPYFAGTACCATSCFGYPSYFIDGIILFVRLYSYCCSTKFEKFWIKIKFWCLLWFRDILSNHAKFEQYNSCYAIFGTEYSGSLNFESGVRWTDNWWFMSCVKFYFRNNNVR